MENYITLSLVAMVLFGINAIIFKVASNIDVVSLALVNFSVATIGTLIYWFITPEKQVSLSGIYLGIIAGIISVVALITFLMALQKGPVSVVNTIRALSAAVTVLLAFVFLAEKLTFIKTIGVILAIVAVVLLSM